MNNKTSVVTVEQVFEQVKEFGIIAGGSVTDVFFGHDVRDVDVFVGAENEMAALAFLIKGEFVFKAYSAFASVKRVYKLALDGIDVDFVITTTNNPVDHIIENFDQTIKECWYDGAFHGSAAFWEAIKTNENVIKIPRAVNLIRAYQSKMKYGVDVMENVEFEESNRMLEWCFTQPEITLGKKYQVLYNILKDLASIDTEQVIHDEESYGQEADSTVNKELSSY